ncbi:hypothetical protein Bca101_099721 [Brassica carinata]
MGYVAWSQALLRRTPVDLSSAPLKSTTASPLTASSPATAPSTGAPDLRFVSLGLRLLAGIIPVPPRRHHLPFSSSPPASTTPPSHSHVDQAEPSPLPR